MSVELAAVACAILAYAVGGVTLFELPNGRRIAGVAAFGPSVIAVGPSGLGVAPLELLVAGALGAELVASLIARRSVLMLLRHGSSFGACAALMAITGRLLGVDGAMDRTALALAVGVSSLAYPLGDWLVWSAKRTGTGLGGRLRQDVPASVPVYFVLLSCSMLITLSYPLLGGAAFLVMLIPLTAIRREFTMFRKAQETYDQTVAALGRLVERAGYVPEGHHARVSSLCRAVGRATGLSDERARLLGLVAGLHDVGLVSVPDPTAISEADADAAAARSVEILQESEYLADLAPIVRPAVSGESLEGRILRAVHGFERLERERGIATAHAEIVAESARDPLVLGALSRVARI